MGYTHYWRRDKAEIPLDKWQAAVEKIRPIVEDSDLLTDVRLDDDIIFFNGSYETFVVERQGPAFAFCKTAREPYDAIVVACLLVLDYVLADDRVGFRWYSDGSWPEEHQNGIEMSGLPQEELRGPSR